MAKFITSLDNPCYFIRESSIDLLIVQDRGDGTWQVAALGGGGLISVPVGEIFDSETEACAYAKSLAKDLS